MVDVNVMVDVWLTFGGPKSTLSTDFGLFHIEGAKLGLNLNVSKYEVISQDQQPLEGPSKVS